MDVLRRSGRGNETRVSLTLYPLAIIPVVCLLILGTLFVFYFSPSQHIIKVHASSGLVQLPGHVPGLLKRSQLLGPIDPNTPVTLMVGLRLRNVADLTAYVNAMLRPHAVRHYLTPDQIAKAYGPLPTSEQAVIDYL